MVRDTSQFNKNKTLQRARAIKIFWITIPLCLLGLIGFIALMRQPWFFINTLTIDGTHATDRNLLIEQTRGYLNTSWAQLIPHKNILFFSKQHFRHWITTTFPAVASVDISFQGQKNLTLDIHEKKPFAVWCQDPDCFFIDEEGIIYDTAPKFSDGVFVKISGTALEQPIGKPFTDETTIQSVKNLLEVLDKVPLHVLTVSLEKDIVVRVDKVGDTPVNAQAKLMVGYHYDKTVVQEALTLLLADPVFAQAIHDKGAAFEYLDLRTTGKMYYKFLE